ncbi:MAG: NAD(P)-binding domain-containing protein [Myxococcales bacterium]|nr:NAD(P)-binding domain-containing protein [Myxococcales bacterium]MCB9648327.1 NAD(P)-binding domain-containing protein [Deltaproteobacteria bacterium]
MQDVIVIGAGPSGLAALKEMLTHDLSVTAIERSAGYGGVFRANNPAVYEDLYLTTSNYFMAFSDFAPLEPEAHYSSKAGYQRYLDAYVEHFDLLPHIRFETRVSRARFDAATDRWIVDVVDAEGEHTLEARHLIVATGSQQEPHRPEFEGYTGRVLHSSDYRGREEFEGKRVLVVGIGESASDIAGEISEVAAETVVWSRRPFIVAPRYPVASMARGYDENATLEARPESLAKVNELLEILSTSRMSNQLPLAAFGLVRIGMFTAIRNVPSISDVAKCAVRWNDVAMNRNFWMQDQSVVVTKTMRLPVAACAGKLGVVVAPRARFEGLRVEFEAPLLDERRPETGDDFDVIVACTGFKTELPWLESEIEVNPRAWFRHCFPPEHEGRLAFLGWARPHQGGLPAAAELLARYVALLATGQASLPKDLPARIAEEAQIERRYYRGSPHVDTLVDYPAFMDSVADLVGCRPRMPNPLLEPKRFLQFWTYPNWPCWYRKDGVGRDPRALDAALASAGVDVGAMIPLVSLHFLLWAVTAPLVALDRLVGGGRGDRLGPGWLVRRPKRTLLHRSEVG